MRLSLITAASLLALLVPASAGAQSAPPSLTLSFEKGATKRVVDYGRPATATGSLVDVAGRPIPNATLQVTLHETRDGAADEDGGTVLTKADGTYSVVLPPGPSRTATVTYTPPAPDAPVSATVTLSVRAGVLLKARPRHLHTGQHLRLSGTLRGGSQPAAGKVIDLQVRRGGRWLTFADVRTHHGTFSYRYRFSKVKTRRTLHFRALVPRFGGYPYTRGTSRAVTVTIRGRS